MKLATAIVLLLVCISSAAAQTTVTLPLPDGATVYPFSEMAFPVHPASPVVEVNAWVEFETKWSDGSTSAIRIHALTFGTDDWTTYSETLLTVPYRVIAATQGAQTAIALHNQEQQQAMSEEFVRYLLRTAQRAGDKWRACLIMR